MDDVKFLQKTWYPTEETLRQIKQISKANGFSNISATIRYCVQKVSNELNLKSKPERDAG